MARPHVTRQTEHDIRSQLIEIIGELKRPERLVFDEIRSQLTRWYQHLAQLPECQGRNLVADGFFPSAADVRDFPDLANVADRYLSAYDRLAARPVPEATRATEAVAQTELPPPAPEVSPVMVPGSAAAPATQRQITAGSPFKSIIAFARRRPGRIAGGVLVVLVVFGFDYWRRFPGSWDRIWNARRPNLTEPRYLKPTDGFVGLPAESHTLLLFVHGIFGDTVGTWSRDGTSSLASLLLEKPEFAHGFDAYAFGFPSKLVRAGSFRIPEAAGRLVDEIHNQRFVDRYQRIVIIAHSMGGLVAFEALTRNREIWAKVPLIVTYATPYQGSQVTLLGQYILSNPAISDMLPGDDNSFLLSLTNRWKEAVGQAGTTTKVRCAYEKSPLPFVGVVVPLTSASGLCDRASSAIDEDHIGIVKPDSPRHDSVTFLVNALRELPPPSIKQVEPSPQAHDRTPAPSISSDLQRFVRVWGAQPECNGTLSRLREQWARNPQSIVSALTAPKEQALVALQRGVGLKSSTAGLYASCAKATDLEQLLTFAALFPPDGATICDGPLVRQHLLEQQKDDPVSLNEAYRLWTTDRASEQNRLKALGILYSGRLKRVEAVDAYRGCLRGDADWFFATIKRVLGGI